MADASRGQYEKTRTLAEHVSNDRLEYRAIEMHACTHFEVLVAQRICDAFESTLGRCNAVGDERVEIGGGLGSQAEPRVIKAMEDLKFSLQASH
jgi:hypothetical protein